MTSKILDYSAHTGPLYPMGQNWPIEWPMYSYNSPSANFWNGVANGLAALGKTEPQIKEWLQSKNARWMLDQGEDQIYELGLSMVKNYEKIK